MRPGTGPAAPILPPSTGVSAADITPNMSRRDKFMMIYNAAFAAGDPMPALSAAQSMFETGFLSSELSLNANNPYGQTGRGDAGYYDYKNASVNTKWALYSSYNAAVKHHIKRWSVKTPQGNPGYGTYNNPMEAMRGIIENYAPGSENNHPAYLSGVESILREMGFDPNAPEKPQVRSTATTPQIQPTTPMAAAPVQVKPGSQAQAHPTTSAAPTPMGGALKTGLVTGPSAYIGGSSAFHIDTQIMKSVPMRQKIAMVDQMAAGYDKQGRFMEFSNPGVAGERWDVNMSYDEKVRLLERVFAAHSHSMYRDRNSMDYYIPKKGVNRFDKSAEGAEILAPTVGGSQASFASGGGYGNFVEIKDSKGQVIARTGHGDTRVGRRSGTIDISGPQISTTPGTVATASPTPAAAVSSQLPYERTGATNIMMLSQSGGPGGSMIGGGAGTPIIMGSGDVVNSYYKAQLLGFLYKQG